MWIQSSTTVVVADSNSLIYESVADSDSSIYGVVADFNTLIYEVIGDCSCCRLKFFNI